MWMKYIGIIRTGKLKDIQEVFADAVTVCGARLFVWYCDWMIRTLNSRKKLPLRMRPRTNLRTIQENRQAITRRRMSVLYFRFLTFRIEKVELASSEFRNITYINSECNICLDNAINCVLIPCGHLCCCYACAMPQKICPICRVELADKVKVYLVWVIWFERIDEGYWVFVFAGFTHVIDSFALFFCTEFRSLAVCSLVMRRLVFYLVYDIYIYK